MISERDPLIVQIDSGVEGEEVQSITQRDFQPQYRLLIDNDTVDTASVT
jgi:hypothetical protein